MTAESTVVLASAGVMASAGTSAAADTNATSGNATRGSLAQTGTDSSVLLLVGGLLLGCGVALVSRRPRTARI